MYLYRYKVDEITVFTINRKRNWEEESRFMDSPGRH